MKKSDLNNGMAVKTRNGSKIFVKKLTITKYNDDLIGGDYDGHDIVEVFELKSIWKRPELPKLTDDEKVILRNLKVVNDGISKYISRNKNDKLFLRENRDDNYVLPLSNFNHLFKSITHESGVHEIKELIK